MDFVSAGILICKFQSATKVWCVMSSRLLHLVRTISRHVVALYNLPCEASPVCLTWNCTILDRSSLPRSGSYYFTATLNSLIKNFFRAKTNFLTRTMLNLFRWMRFYATGEPSFVNADKWLAISANTSCLGRFPSTTLTMSS
jgi:hypothetical protein